MEMKDFIQHFAEQFEDTEISEFKPETVFHELDEYSSLIALTIIGMIDDETSLAVVLVAAVRHGEITVDKLQPTLTLHTDKCTAVFHGCGDFRRSEEAVLQGGLVPTPAHQTSVA